MVSSYERGEQMIKSAVVIRVLQFHKAGKTIKDISKRAGLSERKVKYILYEHNGARKNL